MTRKQEGKLSRTMTGLWTYRRWQREPSATGAGAARPPPAKALGALGLCPGLTLPSEAASLQCNEWRVQGIVCSSADAGRSAMTQEDVAFLRDSLPVGFCVITFPGN